MFTIITIVQFIMIPTLSPLGVGLIRKIKAWFQGRQGASILQPYKDLWKLFHKNEVISSDASWISSFSPFIIFAITLVVGASIPLFASFSSSFVSSDILSIVYLLAINTFFLALTGLDSGGAFGGFSSSREMTVSSLAEGGFIFSLLTLALITKTSNLFSISGTILSAYNQFFLPILLAFIGFFIVLLAETARFPFDNPATHLELTMIHEAMLLECSGKKLALMEWASANKLLIFSSLGANLFFPWGIAQTGDIRAIVIGIFVFIVKMSVFYTAIAFIESAIAKLRFFRLPDLLFISFILNVIAIALIRFI